MQQVAPGAQDMTHKQYRYKDRVDEIQRAKNRTKSRVRSKVEYVFGVMKLKFGFVKVRYRGLKKIRQPVVRYLRLGQPVLGTQEAVALSGVVSFHDTRLTERGSPEGSKTAPAQRIGQSSFRHYANCQLKAIMGHQPATSYKYTTLGHLSRVPPATQTPTGITQAFDRFWSRRRKHLIGTGGMYRQVPMSGMLPQRHTLKLPLRIPADSFSSLLPLE